MGEDTVTTESDESDPSPLALHVAVDDHSRMAITRLLPDQKAETTIGFPHAALEFFARHSISVRTLLADTSSSYRSQQFRQVCQILAIKYPRARPYSPLTNCNAERFAQTALSAAIHWTTLRKETPSCNPGTTIVAAIRCRV